MPVTHFTNDLSAIGSVAFWSFSPALRFSSIQLDPASSPILIWPKKRDEDADAINILMAGVPDLCHVLVNLEESWRLAPRTVCFHLVDISIEVYARQLLLLWLLSRSREQISDEDRVWALMELTYSSHVRPATAELVRQASKQLILMVADNCTDVVPICDVSQLKYSERDALETVFSRWCADTSDPDMGAMWDDRVRQHLGARYDARSGVFDWDYYMVLKERLSQPFVRSDEYQRWRHSGAAFCRPGTDQTRANCSLISARKVASKQGRQTKLAYWGDVASGPFFAFGVHSTNDELSKKQNDRLVGNAGQVCYDNLRTLLTCQLLQNFRRPCNVTVKLLPLMQDDWLSRRSKWHGVFQIGFFSCALSQTLTNNLARCFTSNAIIVMETAKNLTWLREKQLDKAEQAMCRIASSAGFGRITANRAIDRGDAASSDHTHNSSAEKKSADNHEVKIDDQENGFKKMDIQSGTSSGDGVEQKENDTATNVDIINVHCRKNEEEQIQEDVITDPDVLHSRGDNRSPSGEHIDRAECNHSEQDIEEESTEKVNKTALPDSVNNKGHILKDGDRLKKRNPSEYCSVLVFENRTQLESSTN